ncbi:MAG: hypothetical protein EOO38_25035 [Cytophagaceae bacterium]|nr:MAG: hypothetical protein EOO38_25035 [Cytophagaceae bacterium]
MPRYFFHVIDGRAMLDTEGTEFPNLEKARSEAVRTAGSIIASEGIEAWGNNRWRMVLADEKGAVLFSLDFLADKHGI